MNGKEIAFWRKQINQDILIERVRADPERAKQFFGNVAVLRENQGELCRIVNAYEIANFSYSELLDEMNRVPRLLADELENISPSELKNQVKQLSKFDMTDASAMKRRARDYLKRVIPEE